MTAHSPEPALSLPARAPANRKMRPGGGKRKGTGFELTIAKLLSKHLAPLNFIRTQGSGARVGGKNFETLGQRFGEDALKLFVGDVVPINEKTTGIEFNFCIECKFYRAPDAFPALVSGSANFFKWFAEARQDAARVNRAPLLIFKWNNTEIFAATPRHLAAPSVSTELVIADRLAGGELIGVYRLNDLLSVPNFWLKSTSAP